MGDYKQFKRNLIMNSIVYSFPEKGTYPDTEANNLYLANMTMVSAAGQKLLFNIDASDKDILEFLEMASKEPTIENVDEEIKQKYSKTSVAMNSKKQLQIASKLRMTQTVATHKNQDLDSRASVAVLEEWAQLNGIIDEDTKLTVCEVDAGKVMEGYVNVDTGGHKGSSYGDTIVIDGNPKEGVKSAIAELVDTLEVKIPDQILECADSLPTKTSILDTRSGISLQKYADIDTVFEMASDGALTRDLTDEELEKYGLVEQQKEQQKIIDEGIEKIEKYTCELSNKEKVVISPEFIKAGSLIAYEKGINYYSSVNMHKSGEGITMAINSKPGVQLPENIKEYGNNIVEKLRNEDGSSGAFLHPNGSMFVVGGPKNPEVKLDLTQEQAMEEITNLFKEYSRNELQKQIEEKEDKMNTQIDEIKDTTLKTMDAKDLKNEVEKELNKVKEKDNKPIIE